MWSTGGRQNGRWGVDESPAAFPRTYLKYCPAGGISEAGSLATDHMTTEGWFLSRRTSSSMTSKWWFREAFLKLRLWSKTTSTTFIVQVCSPSTHTFLSKCCTEVTVKFRQTVFGLDVGDVSGWLTHKFSKTQKANDLFVVAVLDPNSTWQLQMLELVLLLEWKSIYFILGSFYLLTSSQFWGSFCWPSDWNMSDSSL